MTIYGKGVIVTICSVCGKYLKRVVIISYLCVFILIKLYMRIIEKNAKEVY